MERLTRLEVASGLGAKYRQIDIRFTAVDYGVRVLAGAFGRRPVSHDHLEYTQPEEHRFNNDTLPIFILPRGPYSFLPPLPDNSIQPLTNQLSQPFFLLFFSPVALCNDWYACSYH
jgi:hypothetical protein